jgi:hypothetical protein
MWVPKQLTDEHKRMRIDICSYHWLFIAKKATTSCNGEPWTRQYQPETKRKIMRWKHPSSPVAKKFKTQPSAGELMLTIFWDSQGPILETYLERGTTVTSATCCDMLQRRLKPAIRSKIRDRMSEDIVLLHDKAPPHTAAHTLETLGKWKRKVIELPAHIQIRRHLIFTFLGRLKKL